MDAGNLLKPALARGELHCIGATTISEYRKYIEKDPALERRFQPVLVSEPSVEDTIAILRGLKERYEVHHGVRIKDAAILAAATLSHRYIADRFLPDKAIDLIDEAAASLRMQIDSLPVEIDEIERRILSMTEQIENGVIANQQQLTAAFQTANANLNNHLHQATEDSKKQIAVLDKALEEELRRAIESLGRQLTALSQKFVQDYTPLTAQLQRVLQSASAA